MNKQDLTLLTDLYELTMMQGLSLIHISEPTRRS